MATTMADVERDGATGRGGDRATGFLYDGVMAGREVRAGLSRRSAACRPLPMEDLCFFVKPIHNSRLVRVLDPHSRWECLKMLLGIMAVFLMAVGYAAPYLAMLRTGYKIEELRKDHETLVEQKGQLQVKEAELRDPQRIDSIARTRLGMDKPAPQQVTWPDGAAAPSTQAELAQNLSRIQVEGR